MIKQKKKDTSIKKVQSSNNQTFTRPDSVSRNTGVNIIVPLNSQNKQLGNYDTYRKDKPAKLSNDDLARYESIYKKIETICKDQNIDINLAKNFNLLEKLAGVISSAELVQLNDDRIDELVSILDKSLGWGDGLGFGDKDENDLNKLVKDIHVKLGYQKTGGSKLGQVWHNIKNDIKDFFNIENINSSKTSEEINNYYQKK